MSIYGNPYFQVHEAGSLSGSSLTHYLARPAFIPILIPDIRGKNMGLEALMKCSEERKRPGQLAVIVLGENEI